MNRALFAMILLFGLTALARAEVCSDITHAVLTVDARNDEWASAQIKVKKGDLVLVFAKGSADAHMVNGNNVTPDGMGLTHNGRLQMKLGTGQIASTGSRWVGMAPEPGGIKFRVEVDRNRENWSGSYKVRVIVVPGSALPPEVKVESD